MIVTTPLSRQADTSLAAQLAARFGEQIAQRLLPPGARLPSVRACAQRHGVSPHTVVAAYDALQARGLIEARQQRGFFVREQGSAAGPVVAAGLPVPQRIAPVSATALARSMLQPQSERAMPGQGTLPADWLDAPLLASALRRVAGSAGYAAHSLRYGEPAGEPRLREALSRKLAEWGVLAQPAQIVTTLGATQALDLVTRSLVQAGDSVLVDEPGWSLEYARLRAAGLHLLPVPRGDDGPDLAVMAQLISAQPPERKPRLYVTVSVLHNPTGASLSLGCAHRLLQLTQAHGITVMEDDTYAHLAPPHQPRLAALDGLQHAVYVCGFSKILAPSWRVGFVAAAPALVDRLIDTKLLTSLTTPSLTELALAHCLEHGLLRRHTERVSQRLSTARARCIKLVESAGYRFAAPPRGLFGWVDVGADTQRLSHALLDAGWLIAPGALFFAHAQPSTLMRINFASSTDLAFWRALAQAIAQMAPAASMRHTHAAPHQR